ncbi:MAG: Rossman fold protein, TIGR00730 family [Candidatus Rokubacteria bacterium RIFCSPHIGHO2_12_FULL_73_22]|nr:MAG: Rossman fold protein, TIGR00730 family [Candidatus Rokubacteria bacterium RIFCSPHIGHO2_02_FULL_73_26]OGL04102.1 MAG: Rossman fold protein, TIGR00730 family [Candidatus Rokubacteria bacterium RIFCSPHIGHO2_12_FULL_73_22]OGL08800.1 MAG: Rossman fold protein, TIGR00730 family [Candidatus Rokubacteria bacterium RIFCSPLOWO2_02_FULL_73_56]OGL26594.1 MAG: Rossman fold protein, TIGR00730 family [Candidatus Rokubacteria bacterium RIFCSPLOWO2_12_FULL_73_47]
MAERRYQLQNERANELLGALLDAAAIAPEQRAYYQQLLTTVLKLSEDGASPGDLKITNTALKELRYAYKVFAPYRDTRKVTVFGSSRTTPEAPEAEAARRFGRLMVEHGWMVVTGAGGGIMGATQQGAGREQSFGLNIRLPFEQEANPWIADDPKLITFKYFFTRKLFLVKEASAVALFPGGFGTMDETFELLTLMQTGKAAIVPVVLLEAAAKPYWRILDRWTSGTLAERGLIEGDHTSFYRIVDSVEEAVAEITGFYRAYHSSRIVGGRLVLRLTRALAEAQLAELQGKFGDVLEGPAEQASGPVAQEANEFPELPRLILPFNRASYARLRQLIDFVNTL